jgi:hypothetical protein
MSGVGDFSQQGIDSFVATHCCSTICEALQLDKVQPLVKKSKQSGEFGKDTDIDDKEEGELDNE